jgi:hypothetical protein
MYTAAMTDKNILNRIEKLEARNQKVEGDKAWETSWTRRLSIMVLTYIIVAFYLRFVVHIDPWINALVPVIGFLLSTVTVSRVKKVWVAHRSRHA